VSATTFPYSPQIPAGARRTHKVAAGLGTLSLALGFALTFAGINLNVDQTIPGFLGMLVNSTAIVIAVWGTVVPLQYSRLDKDGDPISPIRNTPGSVWTYYIGQQEIHANEAYNYRFTDVTVYRSVRMSLVHLSYAMICLAGVLIVIGASLTV
jgi:hypothetical protein